MQTDASGGACSAATGGAWRSKTGGVPQPETLPEGTAVCNSREGVSGIQVGVGVARELPPGQRLHTGETRHRNDSIG